MAYLLFIVLLSIYKVQQVQEKKLISYLQYVLYACMYVCILLSVIKYSSLSQNVIW